MRYAPASMKAESLFADLEREQPPHRVRALAGTLAAYTWPGSGSFDKLSKRRQDLAIEAARDVLARLAREGASV